MIGLIFAQRSGRTQSSRPFNQFEVLPPSRRRRRHQYDLSYRAESDNSFFRQSSESPSKMPFPGQKVPTINHRAQTQHHRSSERPAPQRAHSHGHGHENNTHRPVRQTPSSPYPESLPPSYPPSPGPSSPPYGNQAPPAYDDIFGAPPGSSRPSASTQILSSATSGKGAEAAQSARSSTASTHGFLGPSAPPAYPSYPPSQGGSNSQPGHPHVLSRRRSQMTAEQQAEEDELRMWFAAVDESNDGHISVNELRQALVNDNFTPFNLDTVKMMLKMFDKDVNSTIEFAEFAGLKRYIQEWRRTFEQFDRDHSRTIDTAEIQQALSTMGYSFPMDFCSQLCERFSKRAGGNRMDMDGFIYACAMINALNKEHQKRNQGISLETYLRNWLRT